MPTRDYLRSDGPTMRLIVPNGLSEADITALAAKSAEFRSPLELIDYSGLSPADIRLWAYFDPSNRKNNVGTMSDEGSRYLDTLQVKWEPRDTVPQQGSVGVGSAALSSVLLVAWSCALAWAIWKGLSGGRALNSLAPKNHTTITSRAVSWGLLGASIAPIAITGMRIHWGIELKDYVYLLAISAFGWFWVGGSIGLASWCIPAWRGQPKAS